MKGTGKAPLVGLALAAGLVTAALGLSARWPVWLWAAPAAVAVVLAVLLALAQPPAPGPKPGPDEPPWEETHVNGVALPSRVPDYDFHFSATVWWRPIRNTTGLVHADPAGLAVETVLARARAVTEREVPERLDLVLHRLNGVLGTQSPDVSGLVEAMGSRVELSLSEDDRARLGKLSEVRKTEEVWEHERRYEQSKRVYLGKDVFKSPGSAVMWWLARHDEQIGEAVDMIGPLAQLSAAANDEPVDELYEHLVPRTVPFLDDVSPTPPRLDDDGKGSAGAGGPRPPGPGAPPMGPRVVGPLNELLADVDLAEDTPVRHVYARRVADATHAAGRPEAARLIRESLLGDDGADPGPTADARQQPAAEQDDRLGSRWTKLHDVVNGHAGNGTSPGTEEAHDPK
ncbi:hypothetical protein ACFVSN_26665 [Kitasatospora sp. NPDC057904]|uniref:hypothetical protein n=1 Tax=unclassified Kitasatospora TaxID=2633591 RepID=UPI0036DF941C